MTVPAGTQSGSVFRLRGRGVPHLKGEGRGDQHVTVVVETPQNLARHERELFEALRRFDDDEHYPRRAELRAKAERQS
jgi:molecular chaperone DnaJ